ncbi:NAD-dependent epimerase/dehydratase family protein [Fibrella sp. HMF5335]|uniref:NAD-dependent epimerase/dehydratase family protein n=1 Tax=Fibrella rubiginis TaxID=2817060 RepID=A0A939GAB0_9BACT|nr:NAD-dependent epimerase/dehydratase family protein [Fibrella rubiginis]MBO0935194.1 NAD-dependent epimerase/dehydratase family protein [Fibrella rubiginis]
MQTILGAGGAIGVELAKALPQYTTDTIRLVSRHPKKVNDTDALLSADLNNWDQVSRAVAGSAVTYLTVGYDYHTKLWQERWPVLIKNVVEACIQHESKLVFFDNVYAIGGDNVLHITESSPISPSSKKGEVRAAVDRHILEAVEAGKLDAIIARAPDFFGPIKDKSLTMNLIYDNMVKGKKAQWFCNADKLHSTGYTPDLGTGTAILGNTPTAYNQIWNLPVDTHAPTGREWTALFAHELQKPNGVQVLPGWGMWALGLFVPILKEMHEMRYQYDRDYFFDSAKFSKAFGYTPTTNAKAVKQTVAALGGR